MMRKDIPIIPEPPLSEVLRVNPKGFGYLTPEVNKSYIEGILLDLGIGIYVRDVERNLQALAHIGEKGCTYQTYYFLEYLKSKKLVDKDFDDIIIIKSPQAKSRGIIEVNNTLKFRGYRNIEIIEGIWPTNIIFDKEGNIYWLDSKTIRPKRSNEEWELYILETVTRPGLKCENTGEIIKILPIDPKIYDKRIQP